MKRPKAFTVWHLSVSSDTPGEMHFAVTGPTVDDRFTTGATLAIFMEAALNAAYKAFVEE